MATNVSVYDLENYPDNAKTVTADQATVVPTGALGDEKWVLTFTTSAYSDNTNLTAIQDIYVQEIKTGWAKSSGFASSPYALSVSSRTLGIKIDNSSQYYIDIAIDSYGGDSLASEMQTAIRAIPDSFLWSSSDDQLSYKNAIVEYTDGKFYVISGNVGAFYTGTNRTSVVVSASGVDTLYADIGFEIGYDSQTIAATAIKEALVSTSYTADSSPLSIDTGTGVTVGDCLMITDGTSTDYFTALSGTSGGTVVVSTTATNSFAGIMNSYTVSDSKVQILREQDPDQEPVAYHSTVDSITRWGIMSVTNQIDFSS
ncbi:hypothetical protein LCGC14_0550380 [marine sediment metagenome]|uniref:Uncharacterized protein n=1 Tax=marine sediment metagenome TaxID=412755 RepID=A0A0F9RUZ7_9ZZZZ